MVVKDGMSTFSKCAMTMPRTNPVSIAAHRGKSKNRLKPRATSKGDPYLRKTKKLSPRKVPGCSDGYLVPKTAFFSKKKHVPC